MLHLYLLKFCGRSLGYYFVFSIREFLYIKDILSPYDKKDTWYWKKKKEKLTTTLFKFLPGWVVNQSKIILKSELLHVHRYIYIYILLPTPSFPFLTYLFHISRLCFQSFRDSLSTFITIAGCSFVFVVVGWAVLVLLVVRFIR